MILWFGKEFRSVRRVRRGRLRGFYSNMKEFRVIAANPSLEEHSDS